MKRSISWLLTAVLLLSGTLALALKTGDTIYVRARDARLYNDGAGNKVKASRLQPGEKLKWLEQSKENPRYHKVQTEKGATAWIFFQDVSATAPKSELVVTGDKSKTVDAQAFASYGAAARGLTAETKAAASKSKNREKTEKVAEQLAHVEALVKANDRKGGQ